MQHMIQQSHYLFLQGVFLDFISMSDPKRFIPDPDPTLQVIPDPDPDPTSKVIPDPIPDPGQNQTVRP